MDSLVHKNNHTQKSLTTSNLPAAATTAVRGTTVAPEEESPEYAVGKVVLELTRLTLESLQQQNIADGAHAAAASAEDSVWASPLASSTVASLMPWAPVLRHRHVAVS